MMETKELITRQLDEMAKHRWIESEKAGYDLGEKAMLDWVDKYSDQLKRNLNIEKAG
ncbi:MAG: hypothetical protein NE327_02090 [Lentisphaeraceae bacterium]|nr:hypothetical protein [Lentisphaeraceae bacterium]